MMLDMAELVDDQALDADLCIVGAGAAGIALALQFIDRGINVLVIESGGRRRETEIQELYAGSVVEPSLHPPADRFRCRQFGGSTTLWGGRCAPFDPIDFENRAYIPHSGWPFAIDELAPFYPRANELCEAGQFAYRIEDAFDRPTQSMIKGFESDAFSTDTLERFSMPTNFAVRYGAALEAAPNVRVLLHANATQLVFDDTGTRLFKVGLTNLSGKTATVTARTFVLATGGLEVTRLLLANRTAHPNGIGNAHDVVGRYYMCHVAGTLGRIRFDPSVPVWHDYDIAEDGTYCRRRLALRPDVQREHKVGNFIARLHHPRLADPEHRTGALSLVFLGAGILSWEYRTRLASERPLTLGDYGRHVANIARSPLETAAFAYRVAVGSLLARRKIPSLVVKPSTNTFSLDFHAEQVPNPESRITLGNETDALGLPRINIDWRYTRQDVETVSTSVALLAADLQHSNVATLDYDPASVEAEVRRDGAYGGHHIGTARMGDDPRTSVVDPTCRVHGTENLYIASAATFPTSGPTSPTLTLVALVLRLAQHLGTTLRA